MQIAVYTTEILSVRPLQSYALYRNIIQERAAQPLQRYERYKLHCLRSPSPYKYKYKYK